MPYSWEKTLTTNFFAMVPWNFRNILSAANISTSGSQIRIKIEAYSSGYDLLLSGASIGERDGSTINTVDTPIRITWDEGNNGTTVSAGQEKWSDWIDFDLDETKDYLVHICYTGASFWGTRFISSGGDGAYSKQTSDDDTLVQSPTGYSTDSGWQYEVNALDASTAVHRSIAGSLHKDAEVARKGMLNRTLSGDF